MLKCFSSCRDLEYAENIDIKDSWITFQTRKKSYKILHVIFGELKKKVKNVW